MERIIQSTRRWIGASISSVSILAIRNQGRPGTARTAAKLTAAGLVVGFLTGFLGVGGGFIVVPALVMALGFDMPVAVGASYYSYVRSTGAGLIVRGGLPRAYYIAIGDKAVCLMPRGTEEGSTLELDSDADFTAIKAAHRRLVKETHPDANPGDEEAAKRFKQVQAAYDVLRKAEERKNGKAA